MAEDWVTATAKKVEGRIAEEAERIAIRQKRFDEGVEKFRKTVLDLVGQVNAKIASEPNRIQTVVLHNGVILTAAYKRIVTQEVLGAVEGVPASVGKVVLLSEDRKAATPPEPDEVFITQAGTQTAFYHYVGKDLKQFLDPEFKKTIEYFAS